MIYPDGTLVDYVRNALGIVTEIGVARAGSAREVLLSGANRYPFGPSSGWSYGNGRALSREVDKDYRPLSLRGGVGGLNSTYTFNAVGELVALGATDSGEPSVTLAYDSMGRLNALKDGSTGAIIDSYTYDATGNRLSAKVNGVEHAYVYPSNSHRVSSVAGAARSYDLAGNTLSIEGNARDFSYNAANRMSAVRVNGTLAAEYHYNELGQQTSGVAQGEAVRHLYDEQGLWLGSYDQTNTARQQVIWLDDLPVGVIEGGSLQYVEPDHLGAPRAVVNPARDAVIWTWNLKGEAFGTTAPSEDPDLDGSKFEFSLRLPGQRYDASTGLSQNLHRDYDSSTGRYIQSDPIGLAGSISTYGYADGNPMSRVDPTGLDSIVTYQNLGFTTYYDDNGNVVKTWDSLSTVAGNALPGAAGPYQSANVYPVRGPYKMNERAYGPNDILKTDDIRGRWIHGGGSRLADPLAPRQGWTPAVGCTRMQNEDIQELVDMVRDTKSKNPKKPIRYQRMNYQRPVVIPFF
jgi:RHS repeat-associated protein